MHPYKEVVLRPGKEESVKRFHPWIFSGAIATLPEPIMKETGALGRLRSFVLGVGHYQPGSIAVRIMSFEDIRARCCLLPAAISAASRRAFASI